MSGSPVLDRSPPVVADRIVRWSSWPLLALLVTFVVTGYAMSGRYGFGAVLDAKAALAAHNLCHGPLLALTVVHVLPATYLAMRRWGWIGGKTRK